METHQQTSPRARFGLIHKGCIHLLILPIRLYQFLLSPWLGNHCRFHPSCSHYAVEAIEQYGALKGSLLALRRLGKCNPWHDGGYDPVPTHTSTKDG